MRLFFLLPLPALLHVVHAQQNVTIDDTDFAMITYSGIWEASSTHRSPLDYNGSHTLSSDSAASATFTFTGVAVYYLSPRWPYAVSTRLSLDGEPSTLVNLTDPNAATTSPGQPESALYSVAWSRTDLANQTHTVVATIGNYIIVDGFIYTVDDGESPLPSSSSAASSSSASSASSSKSSSSASSTTTHAAPSVSPSVVPSKSNGLVIGLGTAFALTGVVGAILVVFAVYQRRKRRAYYSGPRMVVDEDDWGSSQPQAGRGTYAAVPTGLTAEPTSTTASSSYPLGAYPASGGRSDTSEAGGWRHQDAAASSHVPMASSTSQLSLSSHGRVAQLPPGAMPPVLPAPYTGRVPPRSEHDPPMSMARGPSSHTLFSATQVGVPSPGVVHLGVSSPPSYSES